MDNGKRWQMVDGKKYLMRMVNIGSKNSIVPDQQYILGSANCKGEIQACKE